MSSQPSVTPRRRSRRPSIVLSRASRISAALRSAARPSSKPERSAPHSPVRNFSAIRFRSSSIEAVAWTAVVVREEDAAKPARSNSATVASTPRPSCSARRWMSSMRSSGRSTVVVMGKVWGFPSLSSNNHRAVSVNPCGAASLCSKQTRTLFEKRRSGPTSSSLSDLHPLPRRIA